MGERGEKGGKGIRTSIIKVVDVKRLDGIDGYIKATVSRIHRRDAAIREQENVGQDVRGSCLSSTLHLRRAVRVGDGALVDVDGPLAEPFCIRTAYAEVMLKRRRRRRLGRIGRVDRERKRCRDGLKGRLKVRGANIKKAPTWSRKLAVCTVGLLILLVCRRPA